MKPTDEERREAAENLRTMCVCGCRYAEQFYELLNETVMDAWDFHDFPDVAYRLADLIEPAPATGSTSDGYHTFDELYHHRAILFSVVAKAFPDRAWKSLKHSDGSMYDGMFIVGIETPGGQATYHYDVDPYWSIFDCEELDAAPEWDGHTPEQAIERIAALADLIEVPPERTCRAEVLRFREDDDSQSARLVCSACGETLRYREVAADDGEPDYELLPYCAGCGARVEGAVEVAEHAQACGTCGSFRRCCGCGSGWCMELLRPVREDEAACEEHDPDAGGRSRG